MNGVKYIVKKELTRVFTDKKLVFSLFILPVIIMVGLYTLIGKLQSAMMDDIEKHVPSVYIQNMPEGFKDVMTAADFNGNIVNLEMNADVTEIKNGILKGTTDLLVVFENDFLNKISNYESGGESRKLKLTIIVQNNTPVLLETVLWQKSFPYFSSNYWQNVLEI